MTKDNFGTFEIKLPAQNGQAAIAHNSKVKVSLCSSLLTSSRV